VIRLPSGVLAPPGAVIDEAHPLAEVLQYVWTGDAPGGGRDRMRGALAGVYSGATRHGTPQGLAIVANGTLSGSPSTANAQLNAFPYVQIGYGWFNTSGGAWQLSWHGAAGGGTISQLALASATTVSLSLRYAFAQPQRTITVTLPTTVGVPICAIAQVFSATDYRLYVNGRMTTGSTTTGSMTTLDRFYSLGEQLNGGLWLSGHGQGATISDAEALAITANPRVELAKLFQRRIWVPVSAPSGAYSLAADQGSYSLAGQAAGLTATRRLAADQGSYVLTGQDAALRVARLMAAAQGSYALTGQDATLTYSSLTNYTLTAEQGSYTLSGQAAALLAARLMAAAQGSYALTGQDATLTYTPAGAYTLTADQGAYALTGQDAALRAARVIAAAQGSYALTGQDATFTRGVAMVADQGSYALTGQDAGFARTYALSAGFGSYALTGQIVSLSYSGAVFGEASWVFLVSPEDSDLFVLQDDNVIRVPQEDYPAATIQ
jgi:hypothetical protein